MEALAPIFEALGGEFVTPITDIKKTLSSIKAFVFDWDGVFNDGIKSPDRSAPFSEASSMGINLLRFDYWCRNNDLPFTAIITGENNKAAEEFARRENFDAVYYHVKDKTTAIEHLGETYRIIPSQIACFFDDVTDLSMAKVCGLRMMMRRRASPLFTQYVKQHKLCDYLTGNEGQEHGLREACELLMGINGNFNERVEARFNFAPHYQEYFRQRKQPVPKFYTFTNEIIEAKF